MNDTSYITISAIKVLKATTKYLERLEANRNSRKEKILNHYRQKRTWFGFGRRYTEEEARNSSKIDLYDTSFMGGYSESRVKKIETACMLVGRDMIQLSIDDVDLLKEFL